MSFRGPNPCGAGGALFVCGGGCDIIWFTGGTELVFLLAIAAQEKGFGTAEILPLKYIQMIKIVAVWNVWSVSTLFTRNVNFFVHEIMKIN